MSFQEPTELAPVSSLQPSLEASPALDHRRAAGALFARLKGVIAVHFASFAILLASYVLVISPRYAYAGLTTDINPLRIPEVLCLLAGFSVLVRREMRTAADFFVWVLAFVVLVPMCVLFVCRPEQRAFLYAAFAASALVALFAETPLRVRSFPGQTTQKLLAGALVAMALCLCLLVAQGGIGMFNLDLTRVYEFRDDFTRATGTGVRYFAYTWTFSVLCVFVMTWSIYNRHLPLIILSVGACVLFFAFSSHKQYVLYPFAALWLCLPRKNGFLYHEFVVLLAILCGVAAIEHVFLRSDFVFDTIVRRQFIVPAALNFEYYKVFKEIGFVYLSSTGLNPFVDYPFSHPAPRMVNFLVYGLPYGGANTGFIGTSYMHLGYFGMAVFAIVVGLLLAAANAVFAGSRPEPVKLAIVLVPLTKLIISSDLTTTLFSHGLVFALVALWLYQGGSGVTTADRPTPSDG
jgi:hypothetical protein